MSDFVTPRGAFPHLRVARGVVYVSGTSARRPDNTIAGATVDEMGTTDLDIGVQTTAVLENIERLLATVGLNRSHLVDATSFLVNMNDFGGYNRAWAAFFDGVEAPARTTVAVHQLPHPQLLIEIKATAVAPGSTGNEPAEAGEMG
ncbi:MAG: RidA family protein [Acidimicrobiia bacterium]|nr:RidA family protein [Acidimicrobiia bacterium]